MRMKLLKKIFYQAFGKISEDILYGQKSTDPHLTEYRTALISAAVTGKIDVRGGAE